MFGNKTIVIFLFLMGLFSKSSFAGGDDLFVSIEGINTDNIPYIINFKMSDGEKRFKEKCNSFDLILTPKGKLWWDVIPFMDSYRPSLDDIEKAVSFLNDAHLKKSKITLVPMGSVLSATDNIKCSFNVNSVELSNNNKVFVLQ